MPYRSTSFLCGQKLADEIEVITRSRTGLAVLDNRLALETAADYLATVPDMGLVNRAIQIFAQPVLTGLLTSLTLEAGDKAAGKPQARIEFLTSNLNLVLQFD